MSQPENDALAVHPSFIEEGEHQQRQRANLVKPRQKFAPYTKAQRLKRRKEVYRLHFEYGIAAVKIAEMMNVDRNTINNDIRLLYRDLGKELLNMNCDEYFAKQIARLEAQRGRLLTYLAKTENIEQKMSIERLIEDIDFRLAAKVGRFRRDVAAFEDAVRQEMNKVAEKKKLGWRFTSIFELVDISIASRRKLDKLMGETSGQ